MADLLTFVLSEGDTLLELTFLHVGIVMLSTLFAVGIAFPMGILVTRAGWEEFSTPLLTLANVFQTIPSLAVIGIASALFSFIGLGIGWVPAITALVLYSLLPIFSNTVVGIKGVPGEIIHAARGMGMTAGEILRQVELPLSLSTIFAGIRTAMVINIGTAALAATIGADCLGTLIFQGISTGNLNLLLAGAIPTALLAILFDALLWQIEKHLTSPGISRG